MKIIVIKILLVCSVLFGCVQTPAQLPYKKLE
jgi:hypothetical protein